MSTPNSQGYDDLATDYSLGQVLEAFSILDVRGELPGWAGPHITMVASTLAARATLPPYVAQAAAKSTEQNGISATAVVAGLQFALANGKSTPRCTVRSMRAFLADWRKQLHTLRPPPRFTPRGR